MSYRKTIRQAVKSGLADHRGQDVHLRPRWFCKNGTTYREGFKAKGVREGEVQVETKRDRFRALMKKERDE